MGYIFCHINTDPCKLQERAEENHVNITGLIRTCVVQIHSNSLWVGGRTFQVSCNLEQMVLVKLLHMILYFGLTTAWGFESPEMWWCVTTWKVPDFLENHSAFITWVQHIFFGLVITRIPLGLCELEDEGTMILQNSGQLLTQRHNMASRPTTPEFLWHRCKDLKPWTVHSAHSAVLYHTTLAIKITVFCDRGSTFL